MNIFNILEENLPFIVIGLMVIVIFVLAYYTFIKPKPKKASDKPKESRIDQAIINQDSTKLDQTDRATPKEDSSEDDEDEEGTEEDEDNEETEEAPELGKYHIVYRQKDNKWIVTREGSDKTIRVLHTKKEAVAYATIKAINQDTNIVIHGRDGKIEKHGY